MKALQLLVVTTFVLLSLWMGYIAQFVARKSDRNPQAGIVFLVVAIVFAGVCFAWCNYRLRPGGLTGDIPQLTSLARFWTDLSIAIALGLVPAIVAFVFAGVAWPAPWVLAVFTPVCYLLFILPSVLDYWRQVDTS